MAHGDAAMNERSIFQQALELADPVVRQPLLDDACHGDSALRQRLEGLLHAHQLVSSFLEQPPLDVTGPFVEGHASAVPPQLEPGVLFAGRFKLREKLGEGGMGVYVAD